jgi:hypothetical protein
MEETNHLDMIENRGETEVWDHSLLAELMIGAEKTDVVRIATSMTVPSSHIMAGMICLVSLKTSAACHRRIQVVEIVVKSR